MLTNSARLIEGIILAALVACITTVAVRLDTRDTCHSALNR